ncbi:MAG: hypothetical protein KIT84_34790 [Labilithrix sp.]|nr:hypothetical protein [Labilithrix sp.]MCW5816217.1 hypothetical protein [Labilithrix sp.]
MAGLTDLPPLGDDELATLFWGAKLPAPEWTHAAHLRMAWLTLAQHPIDESHVLLRVGIIRLNAFHGLIETPQRGYHETLTRVWLTLVDAARKADAGAGSRAFLELHPAALTREAPLRHYSRERLFSVHARACFVDPDLEPLPLV